MDTKNTNLFQALKPKGDLIKHLTLTAAEVAALTDLGLDFASFTPAKAQQILKTFAHRFGRRGRPGRRADDMRDWVKSTPAKLTGFVIAIIVSLTPQLALARNHGSVSSGFSQPRIPQSYYTPRVYSSPPPQYNRDAYVAGGAIVGGLAGGYRGGGPGATIGGALGGYYGGRYYDNQNRYTTQYYYYPPAYGIRSTTLYYMNTVPRY